MTMTDTTADARLAALYDAGWRTVYVPDTVWSGYLFADLTDPAGRRVQCGGGVGEAEALGNLLRRLDRDGWPETGDTAAEAALRELNEENLDLQDELERLRRDQRVLIRVLADLATTAWPEGVTASRGLEARLHELLGRGLEVSFSKDEHGFTVNVDGPGFDGCTATATGLVTAFDAAAPGEPE